MVKLMCIIQLKSLHIAVALTPHYGKYQQTNHDHLYIRTEK